MIGRRDPVGEDELGKTPGDGNGDVGLQVVKVLEYAHESIQNGGVFVDIPK